MALQKRKVKPGVGNTVQLRSTITTTDGSTLSETKTWTGDYQDLKLLQQSIAASHTGSTLTPTEADQGKLVATVETEIPESSTTTPSVVSLEVIWQELRRAVELHPHYADLAEDEKAAIRAAAEAGEPVPDDLDGATELIYALYNHIAGGTSEYVAGVPIVRRTTTNVPVSLTSGNAWFRDTPPVTVDGDWEFLKTADERRRERRSYSRVEEWTGATIWDAILYPAAPDP